jgi:hypothetical protein
MQNKSPSKTEPTRKIPNIMVNGEGENEGEGNRTADRQYRENVSRHVKSGESEPAAEDAKRALEGEEGDDLREAEREGKARTGAREREQGERDGQGEREDQRAREDQGNRSQGQ